MRGNGRPKEDANRFAARAGVRCGIYTRKSTEEGLDQAFNTLDAQREAAESFINSQRQEGWTALPQKYDDGGYTGANMDRPALKRLLAQFIREQAKHLAGTTLAMVDGVHISSLYLAELEESVEHKPHWSSTSRRRRFRLSDGLRNPPFDQSDLDRVVDQQAYNHRVTENCQYLPPGQWFETWNAHEG